MRIDLAGQRVHARLEKELLILFKIHFDARVVPDFYGNGHAHDGGKNYKHRIAPVRRIDREEPMWRNGLGQFDLADFKRRAGE